MKKQIFDQSKKVFVQALKIIDSVSQVSVCKSILIWYYTAPAYFTFSPCFVFWLEELLKYQEYRRCKYQSR